MVPRVFTGAIVGCDLSAFLFFEVETVLFFFLSLMMVNNGDFEDSFGEEERKSAISVGVSRSEDLRFTFFFISLSFSSKFWSRVCILEFGE